MHGDPRDFINARVVRADGSEPLGAAGVVEDAQMDRPDGDVLLVRWATGTRWEKPTGLREI
ncbi:hypothetical protein [Actinoplanes sp. NPDC049316]|uniref:hypothetical protein n=1 Tax=Actinoplanes sp. NPDC049316 TaxID=3154727 RepID=UPI0034190ED0